MDRFNAHMWIGERREIEREREKKLHQKQHYHPRGRECVYVVGSSRSFRSFHRFLFILVWVTVVELLSTGPLSALAYAKLYKIEWVSEWMCVFFFGGFYCWLFTMQNWCTNHNRKYNKNNRRRRRRRRRKKKFAICSHLSFFRVRCCAVVAGVSAPVSAEQSTTHRRRRQYEILLFFSSVHSLFSVKFFRHSMNDDRTNTAISCGKNTVDVSITSTPASH